MGDTPEPDPTKKAAPGGVSYVLDLFATLEAHQKLEPTMTISDLPSEQKALRLAGYAIVGLPESPTKNRIVVAECLMIDPSKAGDERTTLVWALGGQRHGRKA